MPLIEGLALGSALIIAIGAQNAFVLRQGLAGQHVFVVATVCFLSDVLLIGLGAGGVGTLIRTQPDILQGVAWLGLLFCLFSHCGLFTGPIGHRPLPARMFMAPKHQWARRLAPRCCLLF